jgi:hypothetical protein
MVIACDEAFVATRMAAAQMSELKWRIMMASARWRIQRRVRPVNDALCGICLENGTSCRSVSIGQAVCDAGCGRSRPNAVYSLASERSSCSTGQVAERMVHGTSPK